MATKPSSAHNQDAIEKASALSNQGKDKQALEIIQRHLNKFPQDPGALNLAGTLAARMENWAQAEKYFTRSLNSNNNNPYALYNLSKVFKLTNRAGDALNALTKLLELEPNNTQALNEIGVLLAEQGHLDPALSAFEKAIDLDPAFEKAYRNLYTALYTGAQYDEAARIAKLAIEHIPSDYRLNFRTDLILCLWKIRAFDEARQLAEEVIKELEGSNTPKHQEILIHATTNYGVILMEMNDYQAAEEQFKKVIALSPKQIEPYINIAKLNAFSEDFQGAIEWFERALAINPEHVELHNHLAIFLRNAGRPDLALPHHLSAATQAPGNVEIRYNLGVTQFALGQLEEGYRTLELRWSRREGGTKSDLPITEWTGTPESGRSILVYREQGIGDEILFASCLPDLIQRFERILCVCHSKLKPLFTRSFPQIEFRSGGEALTETDIADLDWQIAIGSLRRIVRPSIESYPHHPSFLITDHEKVTRFRQRLTTDPKQLIIGIGWRSGLLGLDRKALYPYLELWQPLFDIPGVTWVNLQYGEVSEELREAEKQFGVSIANFEDVDHFLDLDTSAALMKACDLIIGPGTSTTMLSAAVGTPTIRLASGCDPFQLGTDHYPWLPSLTPIRRRFGESWTPSIQQTAVIVQTLVMERGA